jgi:D-proline reductase (dithiol) PrdB
VIEKAGIATVGISLLREVTEKVNPPRTLLVPFPMGHPLGRPNDPALQHRVIRAALSLLASDEPLPILCNFPSENPG